MFGIVGATGQENYDQRSVLGCIRRLSHRGPDALNVQIGRGFAFAHARLSIIDLGPQSDQPFSDEATGVTVTYNGEIFNYRELRKQLCQLGHRFRTKSDTEVLVRAYIEWELNGLNRLDGMFAFGLYDPRNRMTILVRDRVGIKPLYFADLSDGVAFASQPSALLQWPSCPRRPDPIGVSSFLSCRAALGQKTLFSGIKKLEPGCLAVISGGRVTVRRWWTWDRNPAPVDSRELTSLISSAVERQLVADAPVAMLLSGGLDSSILAYEVAKQASPGVVCFTGSVRGRDYDEAPYASLVAETFRLPHRIVAIPPDPSVDLVKKIVMLRSHPMGMHNEVAMYHLARSVAEDHKVVLTGEGADELFAGYGKIFRLPFDHQRSQIIRHLPPRLQRFIRGSLGLPQRGVSALDLFLERYSYFPLPLKEQLATAQWLGDLDGDAALREHFGLLWHECGGTVFDRVSHFFVRSHLPALLEMVDNTTMAVGLEARVPFVDHALTSVALNMPARARLKWNSTAAFLSAAVQPISLFSERADTSKVALREAYGHVLPAAILKRRKLGFPVPLGQWAAGTASAPFRRLLLDSNSAIVSYLDGSRLRSWLGANRPISDDFGKQVWMLCNLEIFLREHFA
nr:asparagine synthase (glutamine-hydrolyzing) [Sinorhizobium mexicanum]